MVATFEPVPKDKVPPRPTKKTSSAAKLIKMIEEMPSGEIYVVTPEGTETIRGLKTSIGRIASARSIEVEQWANEEGTALYVEKK